MPTGYEMLGEALGGDSELAYQQGLNLGARTNEAMANARRRVDENTARAELERVAEAAGLPREAAVAASTALRAGGGFDDVINAALKQQEFGFRGQAGDVNVPIDEANRAMLALGSGPKGSFDPVGSAGYQDIYNVGKGVMPLGDAISGGGDAAAIQVMRAYGFLDENGRVRPGMERQAFDVMRSTMRLTDEGGVPGTVSANPFAGGQPAPGLGDAVAPPARPVPTGAPAPAAPAAAGPAITPVSSVGRVASNVAEIERAKKVGAATGEAQANMPVLAARVRNQLQTADRVATNIDEAISDVSGWTAGPGGKLTGMIWGTPAYNLGAALHMIKANVGFQGLQQMRYESPTGGALGQVAVQELEFLQAVLGSLDQAQSPAQLREMLQQARGHYDLFKQNAEADLAEAQRIAGGGLMPGAQPTAGAPQAFASEAEAAAAGLQPGTRIIVNGVPGTWR